MTYDKFEPFNRVAFQDFNFVSNRYEVWQSGNKVRESIASITIRGEVKITSDGEERAVISIDEIESLKNEITASVKQFDVFLTANDRLQLWIIPFSGNGDRVTAIDLMKTMTIGATREHYDFGTNEPYVCSIFLVNQKIAKVTFSFVDPDKLIEFFDDSIMKSVVEEKSELEREIEELQKLMGNS
jgi:hypothetical protein|tara:strand:+ start:974 stop:1528 length:555 start_codon:yes stop_codon:yes gene_type:complete